MSNSKTIMAGRSRRKRVVHTAGDRLAEVCQNTVCHEAPYRSKDWIGADEPGIVGYILCELHGNMLACEKGNASRGGEYSCVFCECCRGTCMDRAWDPTAECIGCGKKKEEER